MSNPCFACKSMVNQVFLVGYMGSGKTSVAKALSANSEIPMLDLDEALERQEGRTIAALFEQEGEATFRAKESALLNEVAGGKEFPIVACGGGITLACGSGASAVGVAAYRAGLSGRVNDIVMDGGMVTIDWQDDGTDSGRVIMQGPVASVCRGHLSDELDKCLRAI